MVHPLGSLAIAIGYLSFALILPIFSACHFLHQRGNSYGSLVLVAFCGILGGSIGCFSMYVYTGNLPQAPGEWGNLFRLVGYCLLIGLPLGVWSGTWSSACLVQSKSLS